METCARKAAAKAFLGGPNLRQVNVLDLFAGIGGFSLGLKWAGDFRTVCYVEINPYRQKVLQARMQDGWLDPAPIWPDVRTFDGRPWRGHVDLITGGFPCTDISPAGKGAGIDGKQSRLWREYARIIGEVRPRFALVENSSALLGRGLGRVLGDLAEIGYDAEWDCIPASAIGAPHQRDRIWILAYPAGCGRPRGPIDQRSASSMRRRLESGGETGDEGDVSNAQGQSVGSGLREGGAGGQRRRRSGDVRGKDGAAKVPYTVFAGLEGHEREVLAREEIRRQNADPAGSGWWAAFAGFRRVADGISEELDIVNLPLITHYIMGNTKTAKARPREALSPVPRNHAPKIFRGSPGGSFELQTARVLQQALHGLESTAESTLEPLPEAVPQGEVRRVRKRTVVANSPSKPEQSGQSTGKLDDLVRPMPRLMALAKRQATQDFVLRLRKACESLGALCNTSYPFATIWKSLSEAEKTWALAAARMGPFHSEWPDVSRLAKGFLNRVERVAALGDSVVPQVVEWIGRCIAEHVWINQKKR